MAHLTDLYLALGQIPGFDAWLRDPAAQAAQNGRRLYNKEQSSV